MRRKISLVTDKVYHILNRSIAGYIIYNDDLEYNRMMEGIKLYRKENPPVQLNKWMRVKLENKKVREKIFSNLIKKNNLVQIIAYCLMPTHFHFILKQLRENGISIFIGNLKNSYSRYFNYRHKRNGPLWSSKFKNILVETDEQLLHLTRYVHLNPSSDELVEKPEHWMYSSYNEYIESVDEDKKISEFKDLIDMDSNSYRKFAEDNISYQRSLAKIKHLLLE